MQVIKKLSTGEGVAILNNSGIISLWAKGDNQKYFMNTKIIEQYLNNQKTKVVEVFDFENKKVKYSEKIKGWKIDKFRGDEEIVRAYIIAKLVNELGYKPENIEIEKKEE